MDTFKIGPKNRHIKIPDGWCVINNELMKEGDLVANIYAIKFESIDPEDVGQNSEMYDLVIRERN